MDIDFDQMNRKQLGVSEYFDLKEENKITSAFDKKWKEQFHIVRHINDGTRNMLQLFLSLMNLKEREY